MTLRQPAPTLAKHGLSIWKRGEFAPIVSSHATYNEQKRSVGALNNRAFVPRELKLYNVGFDAFWEVDILAAYAAMWKLAAMKLRHRKPVFAISASA